MTMTRPELSAGEALVGLLEAYGVDTIFGIPGVHNVEMYRALPRSKIRHVLVRHEQGAGFMADGYARATGRPGVCFTITGPGLTNILTPMGQAWSDSSSMLVISSALDISDSAQGRGRLHEMISQFQSAQGVTNLAMRAYTPKDMRDGVARAFAAFASQRPRPAYLEIPLDLLKQPAGDGWQARGLPGRAGAGEDAIAAAAHKLTHARRPIIILGGGAHGAGEAALAIAERTGAPVLTTTAGKGAVPASHPACWGYRLLLPETQSLLEASDCILAAGTELSETDLWTSDMVLSHDLIRVDIDPGSIARPHSAEIAILGDAAPALAAIAARLGKRNAAPQVPAPATDTSPLRTMLAEVLAVIRESLPAETVICSDMTQIAYAANEIFPVETPRTWIHPVGFGTLGFAVPAAIGAKFGVGKTPVAALVGDYGFQYTLNELGTAVEHKLPLVILLWNNDALGQIRDDMVMKGIQPNAVTLRNPDFQALARAYGADAARPENIKALRQAIAAALKADGPTLIEMTPRMVRG
jgi:5-guanidino-2-oxopentanoate decarboxylase